MSQITIQVDLIYNVFAFGLFVMFEKFRWLLFVDIISLQEIYSYTVRPAKHTY